MKGDRPLDGETPDRLGFRDVAKQIAISLADRASDSGFVIGLEGRWGSGKSSLLYLIEDELTRLPQESRPSVINFRPWIIGNRDTLLANLFASLTSSVEQIGAISITTSITARKAKEIAATLQKFAKSLGKLGAAVESAGKLAGQGWLEWLGNALKTYEKSQPPEPSLIEQKNQLIKSLRELGHRFIVTIDDVDRLEPSEVIEILRLTRSVADFPNIIYLLCYDSEVLAHSIKQATKAKNGRDYLEKIVQMTVMVPTPETFQLRHWLSDEIARIATPKSDDETVRLKSVIDIEGGRQLKTPRSVVRALDSIRFFWPSLQEKEADLADLVWLQLIKDGNPQLYRWIEEYCGTASALSMGTARVEDNEREQCLQALLTLDKDRHFDDMPYRFAFGEQLLGLETNFSDEGHPFTPYQSVSREKCDEAIRDKRLKSPDHYRFYFALAHPTHALTQGDFAEIWAATETDANKTADVLMHWHNQKALEPLSKADVLLERIRGIAPDSLTPTKNKHLLMAFANMMDDAYRLRPFGAFSYNNLWDRAERIVPRLLSTFDASNRNDMIASLFRTGRAIGWLTTILREETFSHGRYGYSKKPESEWIFTDPEFDMIAANMIDRYKSMTIEELLKTPKSANLLYAWRQAGDEEGPRNLIREHIGNDQILIDLLSALAGTVNSSNRGQYKILERKILSNYLDYDIARERIRAIAAQAHDSEIVRIAQQLNMAFEDGK